MASATEDVQIYFNSLLTKEEGKSTGLAAIETLMMQLNKSKVTTVRGLVAEMDGAINAMMQTEHYSASVQSACELFLRFISLVKKHENEVEDMAELMKIYKRRGEKFIRRVSESRSLIARYAVPFLRDGSRILVHACSKAVLGALIEAKQHGHAVRVYITESQPDASGKKMQQMLKANGIEATLILDSAAGYLMERVDFVLFGADAVVETGGIINKIGSYGIAICARAMNKPVYVMTESIKFVKEYPLNQGDIPNKFKYRFSTIASKNLEHEHPLTDYTPPEFIDLLITDLGIFTAPVVGDELIKLYM